MLGMKIRCFFKPEVLDKNDEMYLLAKRCTCVACRAYTQSFQKECTQDKLEYLDYISRG